MTMTATNHEDVGMADDKALAEFEGLLEMAQDAGYSLIMGLADMSECIYHVVALCKNPDWWEPYRAPRYFGADKADAVALWWWFDEEATQELAAGRLRYEATDSWGDDDSEEDEDSDDDGEANTEKYEDADDTGCQYLSLSDEDRADVLSRLREVASGVITKRWDAPRSDQSKRG